MSKILLIYADGKAEVLEKVMIFIDINASKVFSKKLQDMLP